MLLLLRILVLIVVVFILPLAVRAAWWVTRDDLAPSWSRADWSSASLLPPPGAKPEAVIHVYAARVGRWRGIFAHHSWIVVKERGAARYTRYDKVGFGSPVRTNGWPADGRWFGNVPQLILAIEGDEAQRLIPRIRQAVADYPYGRWGDYHAWPGPNSNTFVAHVIAQVPELQVALPPTALGKDWHPNGDFFGLTPTQTGIRLSLGGALGLSIGLIEGLEVNFLGLVAGFDLYRPALKIPGWGRIGVAPIV